jgi:hypothetical protein
MKINRHIVKSLSREKAKSQCSVAFHPLVDERAHRLQSNPNLDQFKYGHTEFSEGTITYRSTQSLVGLRSLQNDEHTRSRAE